jgi:hypothetical protein
MSSFTLGKRRGPVAPSRMFRVQHALAAEENLVRFGAERQK